ncbi:MAG: glycosyltransferase [Planctomycetota bacterium]|nr:glycosyltransferase [Planctomycetota bacterium]MDA1177244.1 glycosyltransferase [Planctomycetota bacterium]
MPAPQVAVLVSTFERPHHLRRVLASIACQQRVDGGMEVVVSDDGSRDETADVVAEFASVAPFRVKYTTHEHNGFHLARCRNEGVAASSAPYLIFLDGDCLIPAGHVAEHLRRRQEKTAMAGYCLRLDRSCTAAIDLSDIVQGEFRRFVTPQERRRLQYLSWQGMWYELIRHPHKPKLFGGNVGIWRADYERVNGYDEQFHGWGCEDDDLRLRLRAVGVAIRSIARWTCTYHMWHPPSPSVPGRWRDGANVRYLMRDDRVSRCTLGLDQHLSNRVHREAAHV